MTNLERIQHVYETLATQFEQKNDPKQRDIFLVLAADVAFARGRSQEAERLRMKLLQASPHSLLRPYATFFEALQSSDVREYVNDLRRQYPPDQAARLLESMWDGASPPVGSRNDIIPFDSDSTASSRATPPPSKVAAPVAAATPAATSRKASPYDSPNYGPKVPAKTPDTGGAWFAYLLALVVGAFGLGLLGFTLGRPFMAW